MCCANVQQGHKLTRRVSESNLCFMCMISTIKRSIGSSGFRTQSTCRHSNSKYHTYAVYTTCLHAHPRSSDLTGSPNLKNLTVGNSNTCETHIEPGKQMDYRIHNYICQFVSKFFMHLLRQSNVKHPKRLRLRRLKN